MPITGKQDYVKIIKNNDENNQNLEGQIGEIQMLEKKYINMKKKKLNNPNITTIKEKIFYTEDGKETKFNLYKENELGINIFDDKVTILDSEEDYESDETIVMDGKRKSEQDLLKGIELFEKKNLALSKIIKNIINKIIFIN